MTNAVATCFLRFIGRRPSGLTSRTAKQSPQLGAAMSEFLVTLPALLFLGLGGLQAAMVYNAKNIVNYGTFEAARVGAVSNAQANPMREELGVRIAPIFGGDGSGEKAIAAMTQGLLEAKDPRYTKIEILNPTKEAFADFGVVNKDGITEIPNAHLRHRDPNPGATSRVNIQDANLLKVKTTYAYELKIPVVRNLISAVMRKLDPDNASFYLLHRIPISSVATVRMQSPAFLNQQDPTGSGGGGAVGHPGDGEDEGEKPEDGQGGEGEEPTEEGTEGGDFPFDDGSNQCDPEVSSCIDNSGSGNVAACEVPANSSNPATENPLTLPSQQTGNPINVVTGNKFQAEVDIASVPGGSQLSFMRHYNSNSSTEQEDLGYGWRHNFALQALPGKGGLSIRQADGRSLLFLATDDPARLEGKVQGDGHVLIAKAKALRYEWRRQDGARLWFSDKGLFVKMQSAKGDRLGLAYNAADQLQQVTDATGYSLAFTYYPNGRLREVFDSQGKPIRYRYDGLGNLVSVIHRNGSVRQYHYEDTRFPHHLTGLTDERGVRFATWAYDEQGRAILSEHAGNERVQLEFSPGQTLATDSEGNSTTYITEVRGGIPLVLAVRGPGCDACGAGDVEYTYTDDFQLASSQFKDGRLITREYDEAGRLVKQIHSTVELEIQGKSHAFSQRLYASPHVETYLDLLPAELKRDSVNPGGEHRFSFEYNSAGLPLAVTERGWRPEGGGYTEISRQFRFGYDAANNLTSIDGPREDVADTLALHYDARGRLQSVVDAEGVSTQIHSYDPYGRPSHLTVAGVETRVSYSDAGDIKQITQGNRSLTYEYNGRGQRTLELDETGQYRRYQYDSAARLVAVTDNQGSRLETEFNPQSQIVSRRFQSADGGVISTLSYVYDLAGRITRFDDNGQVTELSYEAGSNNVWLGAAASKALASYSALGQLLSISRGDAVFLEHAYDNKQRLTGLTDANGNTTTYLKDDFGNLVRVESPEAGIQEYEYDEAGNLIEHLTAIGALNQYSYDAAGRMMEASDSEGRYQLHYDLNGRISHIDGPVEQTSFEYTAHGELSAHTRVIDGFSYSTRYQYNAIGQLETKHQANGVTLRYHYHTQGAKIGLIKDITQEGLIWDTLALGELNSETDTSNKKSLLWGNGIEQSTVYDSRGRVEGISTSKGLQLNYQYDDSGNIVGFTRASESRVLTETYSYDGAGRLSQIFAGKDGSRYTGFSYDAAGNRMATTRSVLTQDTQQSVAKRLAETGSTDKPVDLNIEFYDYQDQSNLLTAVHSGDKTEEYRYNAQGSPTEIAYTSYEYNSHQRPVRVYQKGDLIAEFAYNAWGERVKKTVYKNSTVSVTHYLYENQRLIAETDGQGRVLRQYLYHEQRPVGLWSEGDFFAIHTDHLGTPQTLTDSNQRTVWSATYNPFGRAAVSDDADGDGKKFTFGLRLPGQLEDPETGTYYNYLRDYNPATGRYLTSDPLGQAGGINTYLYANANPLKYTDPLGLAPILPSEIRKKNETIETYRVVKLGDICDALSVDVMAELIERLQGHSPIFYQNTIDRLVNGDDSNSHGRFDRGDIHNVGVPTHSIEGGKLKTDRMSADSSAVGTLGEYAKEAIKGASGSMLLTIQAPEQVPSLANVLRTHLGDLVTLEDIKSIEEQLPVGYDYNNFKGEGPALLVDIYPLHEEIVTRFQVKLHTLDSVIAAENAVRTAEKNLQDQLNNGGTLTPCFEFQGQQCYTDACFQEKVKKCRNSHLTTALKFEYEEALSAYQDNLAKEFKRLAIDQNMLPLISRLEHDQAAQEQMEQLVASISLTIVGVVIPLTQQDLAIEAVVWGTTAGVGKAGLIAGKVASAFRKFFRLADEVAEVTTGRIAYQEKEAIERITALRYPHLDGLDSITEHPSLAHHLDPGSWSRKQLEELNDDIAATSDGSTSAFAKALDEDPDLLDTWRVLADAGVDEAIRVDVDALARLSQRLEDASFRQSSINHPALLTDVALHAASDISAANRYSDLVASFKGSSPEEVRKFYADNLDNFGIEYRALVDKAISKYGMTVDEAHAVFGYTTKLFYRDLNSILDEGGSPEALELAALITSGMNKMPKSGSLHYRGIRLDNPTKVEAFDAKFGKGEIVESSFWSTGPNPADAYSGERRLKISSDSGRDISELAFGVHFHDKVGKPSYTSETLIPPGSKFEVIEIDVDGRIILEQVD